jgi:lipopolysaccharide biosynthesis protein
MSFSVRFRSLRLALKAHMPYVRRRQYRRAQAQQTALIQSLAWLALPATSARIEILKPLPADMSGELCLFVSHATQPALKAHVAHHVTELLNAGIAVVLVFNTDLSASTLSIPSTLLQRLSGVLVRENIGFDFAAWAHAYAQIPNAAALQRLYLINDSIVGPLNDSHFAQLLARVREASADVVGLTQALSPVAHLQSFFLVLNKAALQSPFMARFFARVLSLPTKEQVIQVYETQLTGMAEAQGLRTQALFPPLTQDRYSSNDTYYRWPELMQAGFPYLKTSVIKEMSQGARLQTAVPPEFIRSAL